MRHAPQSRRRVRVDPVVRENNRRRGRGERIVWCTHRGLYVERNEPRKIRAPGKKLRAATQWPGRADWLFYFFFLLFFFASILIASNCFVGPTCRARAAYNEPRDRFFSPGARARTTRRILYTAIVNALLSRTHNRPTLLFPSVDPIGERGRPRAIGEPPRPYAGLENKLFIDLHPPPRRRRRRPRDIITTWCAD